MTNKRAFVTAHKAQGAVLDNHKWGYHGTYEKESFKQAQTSPFD